MTEATLIDTFVFDNYSLPYIFNDKTEAPNSESSEEVYPVTIKSIPLNELTDENNIVIQSIVQSIYGKELKIKEENEQVGSGEAVYNVWAQVVPVKKTEEGEEVIRKNILFGYVAKSENYVTNSSGNVGKGKKGSKTVKENTTATWKDNYIFALTQDRIFENSDDIETPKYQSHCKIWKIVEDPVVDPQNTLGSTLIKMTNKGLVIFGKEGETDKPDEWRTIIGWYTEDKGDTYDSKFMFTRYSSFLYGMHEDIIPGLDEGLTFSVISYTKDSEKPKYYGINNILYVEKTI